MLFWFSVTKQSFENGFGFPKFSEIPTLPASLKIKRHRKVEHGRCVWLFCICFNGKSCQMIGACIFMTANETRDLMLMGSPIQNIVKFIVHSIYIYIYIYMFFLIKASGQKIDFRVKIT